LEYTGIVLLKWHFSGKKEHYECFKAFSVAMRTINREEIGEDKDLIVAAETLINHFIALCISLYGLPFVTNVVHALRHLPGDCAQFGAAILFSCFEYENFNHELNFSVASGNNPLEQMVNRYNENVYFGIYDKSDEENTNVASSLKVGNFIFRAAGDQKVNSYCGTENGLYQIKSFERDEYGEVIGIEAWKFKKAENFFKTPINSSDVGIYKCSDLSPNICSLKQIDITAKYYGIPKPANDNKMILVQLLHAF